MADAERGANDEPQPPKEEEGEEEAHARAFSVDTDATFGIDEGEAEQLERKWVGWSRDVEENKRLVLDEVEDVMLGPDGWTSHSPRRDPRPISR